MPAEQASRETLGAPARLFESVFVPFLAAAQNPDGGWGYHQNGVSRVEPTCWALLALEKSDREAHKAALDRARAWLEQTQLPDGSWGAGPGAQEGCWATSLACLGLLGSPEALPAVARGISWLGREYPPESKQLFRLRYRLSGARKVNRQDPTLPGWNWTPGTASWVEPTAYALLLLANAPPETLLEEAAERRQKAEAMLYDRMCPGGGWNLGNPEVYGVAGIPRVAPTAWALLALQAHPERPEVQQSLGWLEAAYDRIQGANSLALASICLEAYGRLAGGRRSAAPLEPELARLYNTNRFLGDVRVFALAALALEPGPDCLRWKRKGAGD
jgi:Squalene-hopene cyclase C-terminal domain